MENNENINLNSFYTGTGGSNKRGKKPQKRKPKSKFKRWWSSLHKWQKTTLISLCSIVAALLLTICIVLGIGLSALSKIQDPDFNELTSSDLNIIDVIDENIFNIALFGVDSRVIGNFEGRSDSIMILSINKSTNVIKLISIMRDSLVPIEYGGSVTYDKLTAAYSLGGPALAVKTLNSLFGLDIMEYATVNFYGMTDIIEAVGGIDVEITYDEINASSYNINWMIEEQCIYMNLNPEDYYVTTPGLQHLNGLQAVSYARIRHAENFNGRTDDFGRTERQRYVMQQLLDKALAMELSAYPNLIKKLLPYVKTSLNNSELLSLAKFLSAKPQMTTSRIPDDRYIINADYRGTGASTVYYNYKFAGTVLRAFIYDNILPEDYMDQNGVDLTSWYAYDPYDPPSQSSSDSSSDDSPSDGGESEVPDNGDEGSENSSSEGQSSEIQDPENNNSTGNPDDNTTSDEQQSGDSSENQPDDGSTEEENTDNTTTTPEQ